MNFKIIIVFIFLIYSNIFSNDKILLKKISGEWVPEYDEFGWRIQFFENAEFEESFGGEGCGGYKGTYVLEKNTVKLQPYPNQDCINEDRIKNNNCKIVEDETSYYSKYKLVCNKEELFSKTHLKKNGEPIKIGKVEAVIVNPKNYISKEVIYFREGPGIKFKSIACNFESVDTNIQKKTKTIPKESSLTVIARETKKVRVQNKENYWYYVKPITGWYSSGCDKKIGWVFGEYIKLVE